MNPGTSVASVETPHLLVALTSAPPSFISEIYTLCPALSLSEYLAEREQISLPMNQSRVIARVPQQMATRSHTHVFFRRGLFPEIKARPMRALD